MLSGEHLYCKQLVNFGSHEDLFEIVGRVAFIAFLPEIPLMYVVALVATAALGRGVFGFGALFVARSADQAFMLAR